MTIKYLPILLLISVIHSQDVNQTSKCHNKHQIASHLHVREDMLQVLAKLTKQWQIQEAGAILKPFQHENTLNQHQKALYISQSSSVSPGNIV